MSVGFIADVRLVSVGSQFEIFAPRLKPTPSDLPFIADSSSRDQHNSAKVFLLGTSSFETVTDASASWISMRL